MNSFICKGHVSMKKIQINEACIKVEECNEPSCEALIFPYGVVLFNIFSTICI